VRNALADALLTLANEDDRVVLLTGDVGNRMFDRFKAAHPTKFINCGIAEANMITVAAGMAREGLRPVTYAIAPFTTYRCLEQIRLDVCYHRAPVLIVGVGSGLGYANLGPTHHSLEDLAGLRPLPDLHLAAPVDPLEVHHCVRAAMAADVGTYLRIGKKGEPAVLPADSAPLPLGRARTLREGGDVVFLSTGVITATAVEAAAKLADEGIEAAVDHHPWVDPLDVEQLARRADEGAPWVIVEEHAGVGGFGGAIAEWALDARRAPKVQRCHTPPAFFHEAGSPAHARAQLGLSTEALVQAAKRVLAA
jgi:transketolase